MVETKPNVKRTIKSALLLLFLILCPTRLHAQETIKISHDYDFGQIATFSLSLSTSSTNATEATLFVNINNERTTHYIVPLADNQSQYQWDLRTSPIPPYAQVSYWWQFENTQGEKQTTTPIPFSYIDNRYTWQELTRDSITLKWVSGETALMLNALDIATTALTDIELTLQSPTTTKIDIYIYPSLSDLRSALRLTGRTWVGGRAYPELGVVLLAIPPGKESIVQMKRDIPHELAHKVVYDRVGPLGHATLPIWLIEGLASHFEQSPTSEYAIALEKAAADKQFLTFETLCYPFSDDRTIAILSYAQSQSFISYLQKTYGWSTLRTLIDTYANGLDCSVGVQQVIGNDLTTIEREWHVWYSNKEQTPTAHAEQWATIGLILNELAPWLLLIVAICLPGILFLAQSKIRQHKPMG